MGPKFNLGKLFLTRGINDLVAENIDFAQFITDCVAKHATGDWGDLSDEDKASNSQALQDGSRIFSAYLTKVQLKVWVITESDRSSTTVLFPDEY